MRIGSAMACLLSLLILSTSAGAYIPETTPVTLQNTAAISKVASGPKKLALLATGEILLCKPLARLEKSIYFLKCASTIGETGYQKDEETDLYYAQQRYYDSFTGRFLREDPFEGNINTPPSLHRYLYAYVNPTSFYDPNGLDTIGLFNGSSFELTYGDDGLCVNTLCTGTLLDSAGDAAGSARQSLETENEALKNQDLATDQDMLRNAGGQIRTKVLSEVAATTELAARGLIASGLSTDQTQIDAARQDFQKMAEQVTQRAQYLKEHPGEAGVSAAVAGADAIVEFAKTQNAASQGDRKAKATILAGVVVFGVEMVSPSKARRFLPDIEFDPDVRFNGFTDLPSGSSGGVAKRAGKADTLKPGPFANESIPAHRGRPTAAEQRKVNELMEKHGCHTCGTKEPGTKSGNAVADHQPAQALDEPKEFFPHCIECARRQGGQVLQEKIKRNQ